MKEEEKIAKIFQFVTTCRFLDVIKGAGSLRGNGGFVRVYIFFYLLGCRGALPSVEHIARYTGTSPDQVQKVLDELQAAGYLSVIGEGNFADIAIDPFREGLVKNLHLTTGRDPISSCICLSTDEIADLKEKLGSEYMTMYHTAASYKYNLLQKGAAVKASDYSLVLQAKDWVKKKRPKKGEDIEPENYNCL